MTMKRFKLNNSVMDKLKQYKLEEQALETASLLLDHIEFELNSDKPNVDKIEALSKVYSELKPYF